MKYAEADDYLNAIWQFSGKSLYIAGAGRYGEILGKYFDKHGIVWKGYVDKRAALGQINGKRVYSYEDVNNANGIFVISTYMYRRNIEQELKKRGIEESQIIVYEQQHIFYHIYNDLVLLKKYTDRIKKFRGIYEGKRCFIIGNGPSLRIKDLEILKDEVTFSCNSIYALYEQTDWRPTYYCAGDPIFCKKVMADKANIRMLLNNCKAVFTSIMGEGVQYRDDPDINELYYMRPSHKKDENGLPLFSSEFSEQVYVGGTIAYTMLQLAVYMGFEQIYLLGVDCNYLLNQAKNNHMKELEAEERKFTEDILGRFDVPYIVDMDLQLAAYQSARQYADTHGIKIYNATRGGKLEVFERVDFDSLF